MALTIADRVRETSVTTGTGNFTLAGAVTGFRTFSSAIGNTTTYYTISNRDVQSEWEVGYGTISGGTTLARTSIVASSNSNTAVSFSAGTKDVFVVAPAESQPLIDPGICQARLTLDATTPVATTDQNSATLIYLLPYKGNNVSLYDGNKWKLYTLASGGVSVAVPSTVARVFDIFAYISSGTIALETVNWNQTSGNITGATNATPVVITSNSHGLSVGDMVGIDGMGTLTSVNLSTWVITAVTTNTFTLGSSAGNGAWSGAGVWYKIPNTRATALDTTFPGIYAKSGDLTRKYLGTAITRPNVSQGQCQDSLSKRNLWNFFNPVPRKVSVTDGTSSWNYSTATWRQSNNNSANRIEVVVGIQERWIDINAVGVSTSTAASGRYTGIGVDSVNANSADIAGQSAGTSIVIPTFAGITDVPNIGAHMYNWLEYATASGTISWTGNNGIIQTGMKGMWMC